MDKSNRSAMDLWVGLQFLEIESSIDSDSETTDDDESLSWVVWDSEDFDEDADYQYPEHADFQNGDAKADGEDVEVGVESFEEDEGDEDIEIFEECFGEAGDESEER